MLKVPSPVSIKATSDATLLVMKGQVFQDLLPKSNQKLRAALAKAAERYGAGFEQAKSGCRARGWTQERAAPLAGCGGQRGP
ncbi:unnamed protein product [Effrenium voratum]|nr:unnamed protein product [Effrenium voratum]